MTALLSVRGLRKAFGGLIAVDSLDFDLAPGEILGLIGPNGAGKTTTFSMIAGALPSTAGTISFAGDAIHGLPPHQIARRGVMRTFQHNMPFQGMSLTDNVLVGGDAKLGASLWSVIFGTAQARDAEAIERRRAEELIEFVGLAEAMHQPVTTLSFGQGRLLEVARALAGQPRLIMFDEPAAGLTPGECDRLGRIIRDISARGIAVLLIEHDMHFLLPLAHRVVVLNFGRKIADSTPERIRDEPAVIQAYLGDPGCSLGKAGKLMLELSNVVAGYGATPVLHNLAIKIAARETVAVLGPNGAGKSTLMAAITGTIRQRSGSIRFDGNEIVAAPSHRIVAAGLALVPEGRHVFAPFTVTDNLRLGAMQLQTSAERSLSERFDYVYTLFPRLAERRTQRAGTLSGGEQQMLAIGRALMSAPRLLLLDEPFLGLAPLVVTEIRQALQALQTQGLTIVLVEQKLDIALATATRAYVIIKGEVVLESDTASLAARPDLNQIYFKMAVRS